ncbi:hypothetical protein A2801_02155 [Candidatus Woesebacteria bacterium RIFCSPHIGHO2_01_FULL_41_10]|uniref:DNA 3'-5' helicase n=1 Tax=Candidatus Woesebacteria bacterium RIFCSPHIGHO2_01_FULL_41_10 TaxID=1802500 RepID=A0A1F7YPN8_9BACT|nr:MAG: hypothetical protein A2801_02155 [Candidatus Woesebacteria bacterium RIFCSPHIGHO2_01_FULL_41_10]
MKRSLNRQQREAIEYGGGPLLIIAGAGTGKTTVITQRIIHLIASERAQASQILALTFTQKAADEMQERIDIELPYGYTDMWVSTFHSFCDRVLRADALEMGIASDYSLLSTAESTQLIRNHLFSLNLEYYRPLGNPNKFIGGLLNHFSRLQDEDVTPDEYLLWVEKQAKEKGFKTTEGKLELLKLHELSRSYKKYDEIKTQEGFFDFGDLISKTLHLFRTRPNVLSKYKRQFKYILIDEFQDTNYAQNQLSLLLSGKKGNITVVGDDDQSIYRFRGAAISNILQFRDHFPKAKVVVLTKNYRSYQSILDASYQMILHNNPDRLEFAEGIDKKLQAKRPGKSKVTFIHATRGEEEADQVVSSIEQLVVSKKYQWGDVAILVRANNHAEAFIAQLKYRGVPHQFLGPDKLFTRPEIVELTSYLKVLTDPFDSQALYQLLSMPELGISQEFVAKILIHAKRKHEKLHDTLMAFENFTDNPDLHQKLQQLFDVIARHTNEVKKTAPGKLLYEFIEEMGVLAQLLNPTEEETQRRASNIVLMFEKLRAYEASHPETTVYEAVDWLELAGELGDSPRAAEIDWTGVDAVNILTIHSAKGLEFPVVFVVNLVAQRFPSMNRSEQIPIPDGLIKEVLPQGDFHLQEERRLFYVGMTRARDKLFLSAADYYADGKRPKKLSPFIFECLGESAQSAEGLTAPTQMNLIDFKPTKHTAKLKPFHVHYLSYSQINTFQMCPMHYKLQYVLGVPTPASAALSMGSSVHNALRDFYRSIKTEAKPTLPLLIKTLEENWINEGFSTREHYEEALKNARAMLARFFESRFDKAQEVAVIEQPFMIPLQSKSEAPLKIGGVIDRVDILPSGEIEIIDYKTGSNIPSQKEVDKNLQLSIYALAATKLHESPFDAAADKIKLSLLYLEEDTKLTTMRTQSDLDEAVSELFDIRKQIETSDFACSGHPFCNTCEYKTFCRQTE